MTSWLSAGSLIAGGLTLLFFLAALHKPRRAVLLYAVLGAAPPLLQLGAFSGRTISQGLLLAEAMGTALVAAWLARRPGGRLSHAPFDGPLAAFAISCLVSLLAAQVLPDPAVEGSVSAAVSLGQILLVLWPIGVYLASAELLTAPGQHRRLIQLVFALAALRVLHPLVPEERLDYAAWMPTFSLFAAPFAMAKLMEPRPWRSRLGLAALVAIPIVDGVVSGKTFLYGSVLVMVGTVLWLRASRGLVFAVGVLATVVTVGLFAGREQFLTAPLEDLVAKERASASLGGRSGRGALARDALSIWLEAPLFGVGPGNSYVYMLQRSPIGTPHNQYLNILVEFGLVGLATWCWFLVAAWRFSLRSLASARTPELATYALGCVSMFAGMIVGGATGDFMIHSIRNGGLELFSGFYLQWVLLGGLVAAWRIETKLAAHPAADPSRLLDARRPARQFVGRRGARLLPQPSR